ncbi:hypothetical protein J3R83DRAFT_3949 [Lanmaoa asiatica]|nr:hypothetical protein J3R83DRAFT_3949 [Lanmaoa asiatica]
MDEILLRYLSDGPCRKGASFILFINVEEFVDFQSFCTIHSCSRRFVPLPKSVTPSRIKSNTEIYDFSLDSEDITLLDDLDVGKAGAISWNPVDAP